MSAPPPEFRPVRYRRRTDLGRSGGFWAAGGLACLLFLDVAAVRFLPWWGVALLLLVWLVLVLVAVPLVRTRPARAVLLPVVGLLVWLAAVVLDHL